MNRIFIIAALEKCLLFSFFVFMHTSAGFSQVIKGLVRDVKGESIPFAKVWIKNTSQGTITNGKGQYHLDVSQRDRFELRISSIGFESIDTTVELVHEVYECNVVLQSVQELEEVVVISESNKEKGKRIMKEVISRRSGFLNAAGRYKCQTYCFTSLDKRSESVSDTLEEDSELNMSKMNITEWKSISYFEAKNRYKDVITGFIDYTEKTENRVSVSASFSNREIGEPSGGVESNPYIFVNGIKDADINIFKSIIHAPTISQRPLISPLSYNAFIYYNFYLEQTFLEGKEFIYEIRVEPMFKEEALFSGTLYIKSESYEPEGYELAVNNGAMGYFKEMRIVCSYQKIDGKLLPVKREFVYLIEEKNLFSENNFIHGNSRISHDEYQFEFDDSNRNFWLEEKVYEPRAFDRDTSFWKEIRPFYLESEELSFIQTQDSITNYQSSEKYLLEQDSLYNSLSVWDFLFNGVGFRNSKKKQSFWFSSIVNGVDPFGVGGFRYNMDFEYEKEFKNGHAIELRPYLDYGHNNRDLKGTFGLGYLYAPLKFAKMSFRIGDTYDFVNSYQSIQGTLSPANRVRNRVVELNHEFEVINGLYLRTGIEASLRQALTNIVYPEWVDIFGDFSQPLEFDDYGVFITEFEFAYRIRQKYILKGNKKIITNARWPLLKFKYRKGFPNLFGTTSDFDFVEFGMNDRIQLNSLGNSEVNVFAGAYLRKNNLRPIEYAYFRTSDLGWFSDPTKSMQMLDTNLSTSNSYLQANFIHHFNGFFLNKIWGINRLKLEETIGGGLLIVPESSFSLIEFYVGVERMFRIRKQLFKIGFYAVAADNNYNNAALGWKVGLNFYDSFRRKWSY